MGHGVIKEQDHHVSLHEGILQQGPYFSLPFMLPESIGHYGPKDPREHGLMSPFVGICGRLRTSL